VRKGPCPWKGVPLLDDPPARRPPGSRLGPHTAGGLWPASLLSGEGTLLRLASDAYTGVYGDQF